MVEEDEKLNKGRIAKKKKKKKKIKEKKKTNKNKTKKKIRKDAKDVVHKEFYKIDYKIPLLYIV